MKLKISIGETDNSDKKIFALFPLLAVDCRFALGTYIVWLEWVQWNDIYKSWILIDKKL